MKAFPCNREVAHNAGMDLEDYFAAKAMQGDFAAEAFRSDATAEFLKRRADLYYRMADAMIKVKEERMR